MLEHSSEPGFVGRVCADAACRPPPAAASAGSMRADELLLRYTLATHTCAPVQHTHTFEDSFLTQMLPSRVPARGGAPLLRGYFGISRVHGHLCVCVFGGGGCRVQVLAYSCVFGRFDV